jgi:integrase
MELDRPAVKIGKRTVDAAEPEAEAYRLWDTELKGFGVKVAPTGLKTYFVRYRAGEGRAAQRREFTLGRHGVIEPEKARANAKTALADVNARKDPQAERIKARGELNVSALCDRYLAEGLGAKKASTVSADRSRISAHIKPLLGKRPLSSVTSNDIARFLRDVAAGKTAAPAKPSFAALRAKGLKGAQLKKADRRRLRDPVARGGKGTATRTVGLLGAIFAFAVKEGLRADNPVQGVVRYRDKQSQRFLSQAELARLTDAIVSADAAGVNPAGLSVIRLLALTGARKGEIEGLRWDEVDLGRSCLTLKDSKTGARIVPIGAAAVEALSKMSPLAGSRYVFPAEGNPDKHYVGTPKVWLKVRAAADLDDVRLHDLRHTFASFGVAGGLSLPMIAAILGHRDVKTTQQYAHLADSPVKAAADRTAAAIERAMAGGSEAMGRATDYAG